MKPTLAPPIRTRAVLNERSILPFVNLEALPVLKHVRDAINGTLRTGAEITTAHTGAFTTIWTSDNIEDQRMWFVEATILARGGATARSAFIIRGTFSREGTFAQEGATSAEYTQNVAGFAVRFSISGNRLNVDVQDDGVLTVAWLALVKLVEAPL